MDSFKKNITNIKKEDRDKYFQFQLPQDLQKEFGDKVKGIDTSMKGVKKRLEEQLETRKKYVELLENSYEQITLFIENHDGEEPSDSLYEDNLTLATIYEEIIVKVAKYKVEAHNLEIEITAQKNVFVDTYMYYKEDFLKRYKENKGSKPSVFKKK